MDMKTLDHRVLLGNEAISRGLVEAGCQFMSAYPGTPSSEILPAVVRFGAELGATCYAEWSTNEKVALETALAAAYTGKRAAVAMKQVGLNVAADPALSSAYIGVAGGLLLIVADDPGLHSSQTEQDSRLFALFAKIPTLDPASPQEARDMVARAFELSERHQVPVLLRPTVRVCHSEQAIACGPVVAPLRPADFRKNPRRWAATPAARMQLHRELNLKLAAIEDEFCAWPGNLALPRREDDGRPAPLGIVAAGVCYSHLHDVLETIGLAGRLPILKIATPYPLPRQLVADFARGCERLLVLEETDAAVEMQIRLGIQVWGRLSGQVPAHGELTPAAIERIVADAARQAGMAARPRPASPLRDAVAALQLPIRRPTLCPGCGHRAVFYELRRAFPDALFPGDIGCYTLGLNQGSVDTVQDMGASITMASGFYHAYKQDGKTPPIFATIGDGTFFHSGAAGLENAVYNGARFVLLVLDNGTTGMTGAQPTPEQGATADGHPGGKVSLEGLIRGCGVGYLEHADPHDLAGFQRILLDALEHTRAEDGGIAVVLTRYVCVTEMKGLAPGQARVAVEVRHGLRPGAGAAPGPLDAGWMPRHVDRVSPCAEACPAGNDIERLMRLAADGRLEEAAHMLYDEHPFPATLGRVCPHPCENACNRAAHDGALSINAIERAAGDRGRSAASWARPGAATGKRVAVVGGGPAGLAAAYHLARRGHGVEVFEARPEIGGMLRWAITEYRLPPAVLERELEVFAALGVRLHTGRRLGENLDWQALDGFDAVFLATGAWQQRRLDLPGSDDARIGAGLDFLQQLRAGTPPRLGTRVTVVGGGNTAIDVARSARRQGCEVDVAYDLLLAIAEEVDAARDEGIRFHEAMVPAGFEATDDGLAVLLRPFAATPPQGAGTRPFHTATLLADHVLVCIGGEPALDYAAAAGLPAARRIAVDAWGRTGDPRLFAGGDASSAGAGTVVAAINSGKRAALAIDERLGGPAPAAQAFGFEHGPGIATVPADGIAPRAAQARNAPGAAEIRLRFFRKRPRTPSPHRAAQDSTWNFEEVNLGLDSAQAAGEAGERCFHCGVCTHCDICLKACPTQAISLVDGRYRIDATRCTGCRLCAAECPRGAITMPQTGTCVACGYCTTWFECPSLLRGADGTVDIDRRTCIECGVCVQVCPQGAIRPRQPATEEATA